MRPLRRPSIRRRGAGAIEVDLPKGMTELVRDAADQLRRSMDQPGSAAAARLFGRLDESTDHDDPVVTLRRQAAIDEIVEAVSSSWHKRVLSDSEAESWLEMLGLVLSVRAAELGLHTEQDREVIARSDERFIQLIYAVQLALIEALDTPSDT
jgi:hypothetical protein